MNRPDGPTHIGHIVHLIEWNARQAAMSDAAGMDEVADELAHLATQARNLAVAHFGYRRGDMLAGDYAIH